MLEKLDMKQKLSKKEYKKIMDTFGERLGEVQRKARDAGRPIIILFEGWRGSRRSAIINNMMQHMDARGFNVLTTARMEGRYNDLPFFTYYWQNLPAKGHMAVYHRSWYYKKIIQENEPHTCGCEHCTAMSYDHINTFEKELTDDNYIILKYFLHISEKQQKQNMEENTKSFGKAWKEVNPALDDSEDYAKYLEIYDQMLQATDTDNAPWNIVPADDLEVAKLTVYNSIVESLEKMLDTEKVVPETVRPAATYDVLSKIECYKELSKEQYKKLFPVYQEKLAKLQIEMYQKGISTVVALEGWDAGGKGGAIRRITSAMDPLGYNVHPVAAPNVVERQYHYLWRFWRYMPMPGSVEIFDRTWYGRVMVERLEGFAKPHEWQRAYDEIKDMEEQWAEHGIAIAKFWLQIDQDEQLRRFTERQNTPSKQWKITDEDWRNREKWDVYEEAINEMIMRTDTSYAPWTIVEGNNKYYARLKVMKTMIELFESKLGKEKSASLAEDIAAIADLAAEETKAEKEAKPAKKAKKADKAEKKEKKAKKSAKKAKKEEETTEGEE